MLSNAGEGDWETNLEKLTILCKSGPHLQARLKHLGYISRTLKQYLCVCACLCVSL